MRLPRSFVDLPLAVGQRMELPAGVVRHLQQVLRRGPGEEVILFNGRDGRDYQARLTAARRGCMGVEILHRGDAEPPPLLRLHLALGISRGERMDFALQKAVELGVASLTPLFTERTLVRLEGQRLEKRLRHWRGVVISACEQSGRRWPPELGQAVSLEEWLQDSSGSRLLLDPRAERSLPDLSAPEGEVTFLVGPEGGLSRKEHEQAWRHGCRGVRLGPRILRAETAPLAALAAAQALWGDFR